MFTVYDAVKLSSYILRWFTCHSQSHNQVLTGPDIKRLHCSNQRFTSKPTHQCVMLHNLVQLLWL